MLSLVGPSCDRSSQCMYEMSLNPQIPLFQLFQTARDNEGDQGPADQLSSKSKTPQTDIGGGPGPCCWVHVDIKQQEAYCMATQRDSFSICDQYLEMRSTVSHNTAQQEGGAGA